jgi:hypothetical protein
MVTNKKKKEKKKIFVFFSDQTHNPKRREVTPTTRRVSGERTE